MENERGFSDWNTAMECKEESVSRKDDSDDGKADMDELEGDGEGEEGMGECITEAWVPERGESKEGKHPEWRQTTGNRRRGESRDSSADGSNVETENRTQVMKHHGGW